MWSYTKNIPASSYNSIFINVFYGHKYRQKPIYCGFTLKGGASMSGFINIFFGIPVLWI